MKNLSLQTKIIIGLIVGLLFLSFILSNMIKNVKVLRSENERKDRNITTLNSNMTYFRTKDSLYAVRMGAIEANVKEISVYMPEVKAELKELGIKVSDVESITKTNTETLYDLKAEIEDTLIIVNGDTARAKKAEYHSKWVDVLAILYNDTSQFKIASRDSVSTILTRDKTSPWWRFWNKEYYYEQTLKNYNPDATIKYSKTVKIN